MRANKHLVSCAAVCRNEDKLNNMYQQQGRWPVLTQRLYCAKKWLRMMATVSQERGNHAAT